MGAWYQCKSEGIRAPGRAINALNHWALSSWLSWSKMYLCNSGWPFSLLYWDAIQAWATTSSLQLLSKNPLAVQRSQKTREEYWSRPLCHFCNVRRAIIWTTGISVRLLDLLFNHMQPDWLSGYVVFFQLCQSKIWVNWADMGFIAERPTCKLCSCPLVRYLQMCYQAMQPPQHLSNKDAFATPNMV